MRSRRWRAAVLILAAVGAFSVGFGFAPAYVRAGEDLELPAIERLTLPNGLRVVVAEYHKLPLIELRLLIGSGAAQDPDGKEGLASLVAGALRRGTAERGAQAFAEAVEFLGAELNASVGHDTTGVTAEFLRKDAHAGFALVAEMIMHPAFHGGELRREREDILATLRARYEDPSAIAALCYESFLYRCHPYGRPAQGGSATLQHLSRRDVRTFYERHYRPNNTIAVVVGDLPSQELIEHVREAFGDWEPGLPGPAAPPDPAPVRARRILIVDKPGATQAQIRLGNIAIARRDPAYVVSEVVNTVFGGGFSSRLVEELRIKRSLTYAAWSYFVARRVPGDFRLGTFTKVETTAETLCLALSEMARLRDEPPVRGEIDKARSYLRGQFPLQLQAPDALAGHLAEIEWYGLGLDELRTFRSRVARVDADEVAAFVRRGVPSPETVAIVVVGPAAEIAPALEGIGLIEITTPEKCLEPN